MKRVIFPLLAMIIALCSCEGPEGPPGADAEELYWFVDFITVKQSDWKVITDQNGRNAKFYCEKKIPQLTDNLYNYGLINAYYMENYDKSNEIQIPLPFVLPAEDGQIPDWIEVLDCDFTPGTVAFYVTYSDFNIDPAFKPKEMVFRVVLNN